MILKIHLENQDEIRKLLQESGKKAEPLLKQAVNETAKSGQKAPVSGYKERVYHPAGEVFGEEFGTETGYAIERLCADSGFGRGSFSSWRIPVPEEWKNGWQQRQPLSAAA